MIYTKKRQSLQEQCEKITELRMQSSFLSLGTILKEKYGYQGKK